jgi:hypothetical protein
MYEKRAKEKKAPRLVFYTDCETFLLGDLIDCFTCGFYRIQLSLLSEQLAGFDCDASFAAT